MMLVVRTLALRQSPRREIYAFGVDGKLVPRFATVARARRSAELLEGYQRHEVRSHIAEIRAYIESEAPMVPNAVVIAFDERVRFVARADGAGDGHTRLGDLHIPLDQEQLPGWIVDGQQRLAAIREAAVSHFEIIAVAFIASSEREQREQFILVNNVRPLPKGLIYELLSSVSGPLPTAYERKRASAALAIMLNTAEDSPLHGVVRTATNPLGRIQDTALMRGVDHSLTDGVLYKVMAVEPDPEPVARALLFAFWGAVRETWREIWHLEARKSRLVHGAGVIALSFLMDEIAERFRAPGWPDQLYFVTELAKIKPLCRWTEGSWQFGPEISRRWNDLQVTTRDILLLTNFLQRQYRSL